MPLPFIHWPSDAAPRIGFGADYNPEQWSREVWAEDIQLMKEAGVNLVSVGIFSWGLIEVRDGEFDFSWLHEVLDLLHAHGIAVDLATATASPPQWLIEKHPEILPVDKRGLTADNSSRQHWRPTSPVFRKYALRLVEAMATEFAEHPALALWHVNNELGCHNTYDYSPDALAHFRQWLNTKYGSLEKLNFAWGTHFWSQKYSSWEQIQLPQNPMTFGNPTQTIDFKRYCSDVLRDYLDTEMAVLKRITPDIPVTTNFMVMWTYDGADYASWADHVDVVSNDHYLHPGPQSWIEQSFSASHTRGIAGGKNWILMEHSTSQVSWQPVNYAKLPGQLERDSGTHFAHGADAICFFQWRQSSAGAEKFHSALVPHTGKQSQIWPEVVGLGEKLSSLSHLAGATVEQAKIAIIFDQDSYWALANDSVPSQAVKYHEHALGWYRAFVERGHSVDVITSQTPLESYEVVVTPSLYMVNDELAQRLTSYAEQGGLLVGTFLTGIADENDHIAPSVYPARLGNLFGAQTTDWMPLAPEETIILESGLTAHTWSENIVVNSGKVIDTYPNGNPALVETANTLYVSTVLDAASLCQLVDRIALKKNLEPALTLTEGHRAELRVRVTADGSRYGVLINHDEGPVTVGNHHISEPGFHIVGL